MLLFWKVRYFDTHDKQFKDRDLYLETDTLGVVTKAAVEATVEAKNISLTREMLKYRHLFHERNHSKGELKNVSKHHGRIQFFCIPDYFEDENGNESTLGRMGEALPGAPNTVMLPANMKQHDIDFMRAAKPDIDLSPIRVGEAGLKVLEYFSRDLHELDGSSFFIEGPGSIALGFEVDPVIETSVSEEEIRSFVMIFRRLYMDKEPGNFQKAAEVFAKAVTSHPISEWISGTADEYERTLNSVPEIVPFESKNGITFTRKRIIDAFLYTQFAHQGQEKRERQYAECLAQVNGRKPLLFWLFLSAMYECARHIRNAGIQIASFTEAYYKCHRLNRNIVDSASKYARIGVLEKQKEREDRVFRKKADELAMELWKQNGRPEAGPSQFIHEAQKQLGAAMGMVSDETKRE